MITAAVNLRNNRHDGGAAGPAINQTSTAFDG
jgi:hypothetical protein